MTGPARVVLHPSRPPGVHDAALAMAGRGLIELVDTTSDDVAEALQRPGSVLVSHRWRADFLTDGSRGSSASAWASTSSRSPTAAAPRWTGRPARAAQSRGRWAAYQH